MNKCLCLSSCLLLVVAAFSAPRENGKNMATSDGSQSKLQYVLGPGDQVAIHVVDLDDVSDKPLRIDPTGFLDFPLIGRVSASGITLEELKNSLAAKLSKFITSPQISINITEYHSQPVSVVGAVTNPGIQQLQSPKRLLDVISTAGGLLPDAGSKLLITRQIRWGQLPLPDAKTDESGQYFIAQVALDKLTAAQNPAENIFVRPNDVVSIPRADTVYVLGQVKKAGGYPLRSHDSISLLRALALAEGLDQNASPKKAKIMRASMLASNKSTEVSVDVQQILDGRAPDLQLHADDVLFIPNNLARSATRRAAEAALQIATGVVIFR